MLSDDWMFRVEDAFHAHFFVEDDPESRAGIEWVIAMRRAEQEITVMVRGIFADDMTEGPRDDHRYQANTCIGFLCDHINEGWQPKGGESFVIEIHDPA
ncbi:hypothetical protein [Zavarzinia sp.]|uniref:hypothetical protein n=1 Tax=Zavarzinia sp. TaxID=2027920 RepID=UPI00356AAB27